MINMRHLEYRIDFNGKRAILQSRRRLVECIDLSTDCESSFSPDEENLLLSCFMVMEYCELQGRYVRDYLSNYKPRITPEEAKEVVDRLEREYNLKPFAFVKRKVTSELIDRINGRPLETK